MSTRTAAARSARGRNRAFLRVPVLAGVGYTVAWIASLSVGAPNPSIAAPGAQVVASFAGHEGRAMAMFVLAEGVAAIGLAVVGVVVARPALRRPGSPRVRLAAQLGAGFAIAAAAASWVELGLGTWLMSALVPERRSGTAGATYHALMRLDGAKMFLLAVMAAGLSALALTAPLLPRWLAPMGFVLAAALVVSGLDYVLLAPGLADSAYVSGILLLAFVTCTGVTFGLRAGRTGGQGVAAAT
jgi:hypothetical protein